MTQSAIIQTLTYSDHFGFPLTAEEIHLRLISSISRSSKLVLSTLQLMLKKHLIEQTGDYYHLPGRKSLVSRRLHRAKISQPLLNRARASANKLSSIPGILAIYLTGSLAVANVNGDADIDFMIITKSGHLWTTRFYLTLYTELFGLRRRPHSQNNKSKLCLNLYLTPDSYHIPADRRSLYTAYELIQAVPLFDPEDTHFALLAANYWITNFLPNYPLPVAKRPDLVGYKSKGIIEKLAYDLQLAYMRPKLTREYVTSDSAFFHPHNPGTAVLKKIRP
jgi:hypothetical protein